MQDEFVVCRFAKEFPVGGGSYGLGPNFYYISVEQAKLGNSVHVVALSGRGKSFEVIKGVKVHRVCVPYNLTALKAFNDINTGERVDVVHAHATTGLSYALLHKLERDRLFVVHVHGVSTVKLPTSCSSFAFRLKSGFWNWLSLMRQRFMWGYADVLIAVCMNVKRKLVESYGFPEDRVRVVYNGVDVDLFKPVRDVDEVKRDLGIEGKKLVLFVGSFRPLKGIHHLIDSIPEVMKEFKDCYFLLVGGVPRWVKHAQPYFEMLKRKVIKYGLQNYVRFMEALPHTMLPYYYYASNVFVLPSVYDPLPKVVLEAMVCGTPVVASEVGGIPEIVDHRVNGLLVPPANPKKVAEALTTILSDEKLAKNMGEQGRKKVLSEFTWKHTALNLNRIYDEFVIKN